MSDEQPSVDEVTKEIYNFPQYYSDGSGVIYSRRRERAKGGPLKTQIINSGYQMVCLWRDKKPHMRLVHRLILETHVGPCPVGKEACHNNGIRTDNRKDNLRWDTRSNNHKDKVVHGTSSRGEASSSAKLTEKEVRIICGLYDNKINTIPELSEMYKTPYGTIYYIVKRLRWRYLWEK